ncbi:hypothetical protein DOTSEDRAFT_21864 [Dothistroma septosporum NZE10]|uniref:Uncharacterized protein n=1 Tax=Dothistroma septosporum (strain NZE10 / CBS 128990) TaxID=675120 RepID=N1PXA4_DOTSN|nr:hypothetical protein DOTSEDRAFT_21864 [Dothistroma septosporum NZE10]
MPAVMQAYIANLICKASLGRLLAIVSLFQVGGKIAASALGPVIINAGIDSGREELKGAIFFFAAVVFVASAVALGIVALRAVVRRVPEEAVGLGQNAQWLGKGV